MTTLAGNSHHRLGGVEMFSGVRGYGMAAETLDLLVSRYRTPKGSLRRLGDGLGMTRRQIKTETMKETHSGFIQ